MNRSARLPQIIVAVLLAIPTLYAFSEYAGEVQHLNHLEIGSPALASRGNGLPAQVTPPRPEESAPKPAPQAKPEESAPKPAPQAKPEESAPKPAPSKGEQTAKAESKPTSDPGDEDGTSDGKKKRRRQSHTEDSGEQAAPGKKVAKADSVTPPTSSAREDETSDGPSRKKRRRSEKTDDDSGDSGQLNLKASATAEVYVDGRKVGVAPITRRVSTGNHKVRFDCLSGEGKKRGEDRSVEVLPFSEVSVDYECQ